MTDDKFFTKAIETKLMQTFGKSASIAIRQFGWPEPYLRVQFNLHKNGYEIFTPSYNIVKSEFDLSEIQSNVDSIVSDYINHTQDSFVDPSFIRQQCINKFYFLCSDIQIGDTAVFMELSHHITKDTYNGSEALFKFSNIEDFMDLYQSINIKLSKTKLSNNSC